MINTGKIGIPYRPIATNGWQNNSSILYSPFFIGSPTSSYLVQSAINNIKQPVGCVPTTGSPYVRIVDAVCGDYMNCGTYPDWCCNNTNSMASNGCPHTPWLQCNPIDGYNSTYPFVPIYTTSSLVTKSLCDNNYGYKNIQSKKSWHGIAGLLDADTNQCSNTVIDCGGGSEINYRNSTAAGQTLYLTANWDLNYTSNSEVLLLSGSYPCEVPNTPWSVNKIKQGDGRDSSIQRTVSINRYTGEYVQDRVVDDLSSRYFDSDPGNWIINDQCGNLFSENSSSQEWTREHVTGCGGTYAVYDFIDGHYDLYGNPVAGYRNYEQEGDPNIFINDDSTIPNCNTQLSIFSNLIDTWNIYAAADHGTDACETSSYVPIVIPNWTNSWTVKSSYETAYPYYCVTVCDCESCEASGSSYNSGMSPYLSTLSASFTRTDTAYTFNIAVDVYAGPYSAWSFIHVVYAYNGSVTLSDEYTAAGLQGDLDTLLSNWNMVDDNIYPPRIDGYGNVAPMLTYDEVEPTQPTSAPVSCLIDDYRNPIADVNGNSPFTFASSAGQKGPPINDINGYPPFAPCWTASYDVPIGWIPTWDKTQSFDSRIKCFSFAGTGNNTTAAATAIVTLHDGSIIGKPNITGSMNRINNWNPYHEVWDYDACSITYGSPYWYIKGYGELNTGQYGIPLTSTQWTNKYDAQYFPFYAANFNVGYMGYKQKWAEVKQVWPSWDFNRPYGQDRYTIDETAVSCDTDFTTTIGDAILYTFNDGHTIDYLNPLIAPSTNDIWGGTDVNGFYNITAISGDGVGTPYSLTTGSLVLPLPSGFSESFCRLKYPNCPAFGTTPITVTSNGTSSVISFNSENVQYSGSTLVDFYSTVVNPQGVLVPNQNKLNSSSVLITYADEYHASCSGDFRLANYLISTGSKTWWCDNQPKGQVITRQWIHDNRTNNENARLSTIVDCSGSYIFTGSTDNYGYSSFAETQVSISGSSVDGVPTKNCPTDCNAVGWICYSNNGENFNSKSETYTIPSCSFDIIYNSGWQGEIVQNITSFDYQTPHKLCGEDPYYITQHADNGTCQDDDMSNLPFITQYYAYPTQIEPFLTLPHTTLLNGATDPAPNPYSSSGHFKWWIDNPVITGSGVLPPSNGGYSNPGGSPGEGLFPWNLKSNICSTVDCRFDYDWVQC